jgi:hypothetical protein
MNSKDGLLLWVLGTAGIFLIYAAYKNVSPGALLSGYFTGVSAVPNAASKGFSGGYSSGGSFGSLPELNGNGVNVKTLPNGYKANPENHIPLRGMTIAV